MQGHQEDLHHLMSAVREMEKISLFSRYVFKMFRRRKIRSFGNCLAGMLFLLVMPTEAAEEKTAPPQPPHIIFILADDLGWNDVSFHGSSEIPTPNIDALAATSIILNNYYSEALCTPSRAALMTAKYPINLGLQQSSFKSGEPVGLPLDVTVMPEHLKNRGYSTHIIGKWHLGYSKKEFIPTSRGFDSFFGFYNEQIDYFDYTNLQSMEPQQPPLYGIDLQDGSDVVKNSRGQYATEYFTDRALDVIGNHNESLPLFLFLSHLAPHSGNDYMPLQAPLQHVAKFKNIADLKRRTYAGMVSALDESVGRVVSALGERGFLQNSLIAFASDSGGPAESPASNWPLRGGAPGPWEGALRVNALLWSPALEPKTSQQLMHVSDWLPTFYEAAGGDVSDLGPVDGVSLWGSLRSNSPSPRIEIAHAGVLRRGDYKLVVGEWLGSAAAGAAVWPLASDESVFANGSLVRSVLLQNELWVDRGDWRRNATVSCAPTREPQDCTQTPCLFNVAADPCEMNNVAAKYPRIVRSMLSILKRYTLSSVAPINQAVDLQADPRCSGFSYVTWMDDMTCDCPFAI